MEIALKSKMMDEQLAGTFPFLTFDTEVIVAEGGEPASCLQDPKVEYYASRVDPLVTLFTHIANFNAYMENQLILNTQ